MQQILPQIEEESNLEVIELSNHQFINLNQVMTEKQISKQQFLEHYEKNKILSSTPDRIVQICKDKRSNQEYVVKQITYDHTFFSHMEEKKQKYSELYELKKMIMLSIKYPDQFVYIHQWSGDFGEGKELSYILYIIMEKADYDLSKEIQLLNQQDNSQQIKISICEQCINIVYNLHNENIYHRDLKPQQFLVFRDDGQKILVKLIDFGSFYCKNQNQKTQSQQLSLTQKYSPPEYVYMINGNFLTGVFDLMNDIKNKMEINLPVEYKGRTVPFLWQQYDSFALGIILFKIFYTIEEFQEAEQHFQQYLVQKIENTLCGQLTADQKRIRKILIWVFFLVSQNPKYRLTIKQLAFLDVYQNFSLEKLFFDQSSIWGELQKFLKHGAQKRLDLVIMFQQLNNGKENRLPKSATVLLEILCVQLQQERKKCNLIQVMDKQSQDKIPLEHIFITLRQNKSQKLFYYSSKR